MQQRISDKVVGLALLLLCLGFGIAKIAILLTSQSQVDGDEAVIGIMAKHIVSQGARPLFFYGQPYNGGAALEAYLVSLPIAIWGTHSLAVKAPALLLFVLACLVSYYWAKQWLSHQRAMCIAGLYFIASALVLSSMKLRGGYSLLPLFFWLLTYLYFSLYFDSPWQHKKAWLLGIVSALAYYNHELIVSLLVTFVVVSLFARRLWQKETVSRVVAGAMLGFLPLLYYNWQHDFANLRNLWDLGQTYSFWQQNLSLLPTLLWPGVFQPSNFDLYPQTLTWDTYLEAYLVVVLLLYVGLLAIRKSLSPFARFISCFLLVYVVIHLCLFVISPLASASPRYLLPLFPALSIMLGISLTQLWTHPKGRYLAGIIVVFLLARSAFWHISYITEPRVTDDVYMAPGKMVNYSTQPDTIAKLLDHLEKYNIQRVYCPYFLQWRLIFQSNEKVIASSQGFKPGLSRYPAYDKKVREASRFAVIVHKKAAQTNRLDQAVAKNSMVRHQVNSYFIYVPRSIVRHRK